MHNGKLVRIQSIRDFVRNSGSSHVCITVEPSQVEQAQRWIATLDKAALPAKQPGQLLIPLNKDEIPAVNKLLMQAGVQVYSIQVQERTLEEQFLEITEEKK